MARKNRRKDHPSKDNQTLDDQGICVVKVTGVDEHGHIVSVPEEAIDGETAPTILLTSPKRFLAQLAKDDKALVKYNKIGFCMYEGQILKKLEQKVEKIIGVYREVKIGKKSEGRVEPVKRNDNKDYLVPNQLKLKCKPGDLVSAEVLPGKKFGLAQARIIEVLGDQSSPKNFSQIAIAGHDIPHIFSQAAIQQAKDCRPVDLGDRTDLRKTPLITIDGEDARDFDDAVWAAPDKDPKNPDGWQMIIAIADVAHYVRHNSALDQAAYERGNSVYFPDRVVPMLPEELSNDLCSLRPMVNRACVAVKVIIDKNGKKKSHEFMRGLMRSHARLTYEQAEKIIQGDTTNKELLKYVKPLHGAYEALHKARQKRGTLDLNIPEQKVVLNEKGFIEAIVPRVQITAHRLIEEFMIMANVCAAETLEAKKLPCMYRVHDEPAESRLDEIRGFLDTLGFSLPKGNRLTPTSFTQILEKANESEFATVIHHTILRTQSQATYSPENLGHFGLALDRYAHFTSPIRRYADLLVHRAIITAIDGGTKNSEGGLPKTMTAESEQERYHDIGDHLSITERRASSAEWETTDRYVAAFLSDKIGHIFKGRVSGVGTFGLFITLPDTGADGFIPKRFLPNDFWDHDDKMHTLTGKRSRIQLSLGQELSVELMEANSTTGSIIMRIPMDLERDLPRAERGGKSYTRRSDNSRRDDKKRDNKRRDDKGGRKHRDHKGAKKWDDKPRSFKKRDDDRDHKRRDDRPRDDRYRDDRRRNRDDDRPFKKRDDRDNRRRDRDDERPFKRRDKKDGYKKGGRKFNSDRFDSDRSGSDRPKNRSKRSDTRKDARKDTWGDKPAKSSGSGRNSDSSRGPGRGPGNPPKGRGKSFKKSGGKPGGKPAGKSSSKFGKTSGKPGKKGGKPSGNRRK